MQDKYVRLLDELRINCNNCSGLCCVALCFRKIDGFPNNKSAGKACKYLLSDYKCEIHSKLSDMNMKGCLNYDCYGAGQKVSGKIFKDLDWKKNPEISKDIFQVFLKVMQLHQILWYLIQGALISDDIKNIDLIDLYIKENEDITSLPYNEILNYDLEEYRTRANMAIKGSFKFDIDIEKKDFINKNFKKSNLNGEDFSMALLIGANIEECSLEGANFLGADMRDVKIKNTDLSNSYFLTQMQINSAIGNKNTKLPIYLKRPKYWQN